jgi:hypothetical protein
MERVLGDTVAADKYAALVDAQQQGLNAGASNLVGAKPQTMYEAGQDVLTELGKALKGKHAEAKSAYEEFERAVEANPVRVQTGTKASTALDASGRPVQIPVYQEMNLPVDLTGTKKALQPLYDQLNETLAAVPEARRNLDPGYRVLWRLMNSPDQMGARQAEELLSLSKEIGRDTLFPELKNRAEGIAAATTAHLQPAIDASVAEAGPKAAQALQTGRRLWREKSEIGDLVERLGGADQARQVSAFRTLMGPKDANFDYLQKVLNTAPEAKESLRRGFLENLFAKPTEAGGFTNAEKALADWNRLGAKTKVAVFGEQAQEISTFLKLASAIGKNPNPSGTGIVNSLLKMGLLVTAPLKAGGPIVLGRKLADVLYSPDGAKNLNRLLIAGPRTETGRRAYAALSTMMGETTPPSQRTEQAASGALPQ